MLKKYIIVILLVFIINFVNVLTSEVDFLSKPSLKVFYCYSCGYQKLFQDFSALIQQQFPDMLIEGANYEPGAFYLLLCRVISLSKLVLIVCIAVGIPIFEYFGVQQPTWYRWCSENKIYSSMMLFFISNLIEGQLMSTGAFEVFLNDMPIWSKLETGRIPQPNELIKIIQNSLQFTDQYLNVE